MIRTRTSPTSSSVLMSLRKWGRGHSERSTRFVAVTMDGCTPWRSPGKGSEVSGTDGRSWLKWRNTSDFRLIRTVSGFTGHGRSGSTSIFRLSFAKWGMCLSIPQKNFVSGMFVFVLLWLWCPFSKALKHFVYIPWFENIKGFKHSLSTTSKDLKHSLQILSATLKNNFLYLQFIGVCGSPWPPIWKKNMGHAHRSTEGLRVFMSTGNNT